MAHKLLYQTPRSFGQKHVQVLMSKRLSKFLKLHKQPKFVTIMINGLKKASANTMNEVKRQITVMDAVYSGFMRSSIQASIANNPDSKGIWYSHIGTKAWYDILVHEGLGIHHSPPQALPANYRPSAAQVAAAPSYAEVRKALGRVGPKRRGRGPRPFLTVALKNTGKENIKIVSDAFKRSIAEVVLMENDVPTIPMNEVLGL